MQNTPIPFLFKTVHFISGLLMQTCRISNHERNTILYKAYNNYILFGAYFYYILYSIQTISNMCTNRWFYSKAWTDWTMLV